jgi:hypothetical protein
MDADLAEKIAKLPTLNKAQLLPIWAENFKTPRPPKLRKELIGPDPGLPDARAGVRRALTQCAGPAKGDRRILTHQEAGAAGG